MLPEPEDQTPKAILDFDTKADQLKADFQKVYEDYLPLKITMATFQLLLEPEFSFKKYSPKPTPFSRLEGLSRISSQFPGLSEEYIKTHFDSALDLYDNLLTVEGDRDYVGERPPLVKNEYGITR